MDPITYFSENHEIAWLIAGAVFFVFEVAVTTGVGFLFIGLGAITVGGLMTFGVIEPDSVVEEFSYFFGLTAVWAIILWRPMKKILSEGGDFDNVVGDRAVVGDDGLVKGKTGTARWSGTNMQARLAESAPDKVKAGEELWIHKVDGSILIVSPESVSKE